MPVPAPRSSVQAAAVQRGIGSIEVGGRLLHALAERGQAMALKDLAAAAGMAPAKAHPYLVSLGKVGLVEQDRASGRYGLGALTLQLGLMSLKQTDPVRLATPALDELAQASGHTFGLAVWGSHGPTIVRIAESPAAVHVSMRQGTVFSIPDTASGRLFAAHLEPALVRPLYDAQTADAAGGARPWQRFEREVLDEVRAQGLARADGAVVAGVAAMAAPVFDHRGAIVLALTGIAPAVAIDTSWDGPLAARMRRAAAAVSARLGHRAADAAADKAAVEGQ